LPKAGPPGPPCLPPGNRPLKRLPRPSLATDDRGLPRGQPSPRSEHAEVPRLAGRHVGFLGWPPAPAPGSTRGAAASATTRPVPSAEVLLPTVRHGRKGQTGWIAAASRFPRSRGRGNPIMTCGYAPCDGRGVGIVTTGGQNNQEVPDADTETRRSGRRAGPTSGRRAIPGRGRVQPQVRETNGETHRRRRGGRRGSGPAGPAGERPDGRDDGPYLEETKGVLATKPFYPARLTRAKSGAHQIAADMPFAKTSIR